jgi:tetratricopeptide (TPR) repeat protein
MSFPPNSDAPQRPVSPQSSPLKPRRHIRPLTWLLLLAIIGSCTAMQVPLEIGRWHLAAAIKLRDQNQKEAAYRELDSAIERFPKSPELLLQRAEWRLDDGQKEAALADCDHAIELAGDNPRALKARARLLMKARQFTRAVEDLQKVEQFSRRSGNPPLHEALNEWAYAQALAKVDLEKALHNANVAIEVLPPGTQTPGKKEYYPQWLILDTRGYVNYLLGQHQPALDDLNAAVSRIDEEMQQVREKAKADPLPLPSNELATSQSEKALAQGVAVIHYHRSLVLTALDRKEEADKDLALARQLIGREPDETLF